VREQAYLRIAQSPHCTNVHDGVYNELLQFGEPVRVVVANELPSGHR
jgi:hypothetical protein